MEFLRESGNAYVKPTNASATTQSISNDLNRAKKDNPTDDTFVLDTSDYDGNSMTDEPTFKVDASNENDAERKIQDMKRNPNLQKAMQDAQIEVELQRENRIRYTKKELNKILFK